MAKNLIRVQNIKTGRVKFMTPEAINALKGIRKFDDFDILPDLENAKSEKAEVAFTVPPPKKENESPKKKETVPPPPGDTISSKIVLEGVPLYDQEGNRISGEEEVPGEFPSI